MAFQNGKINPTEYTSRRIYTGKVINTLKQTNNTPISVMCAIKKKWLTNPSYKLSIYVSVTKVTHMKYVMSE